MGSSNRGAARILSTSHDFGFQRDFPNRFARADQSEVPATLAGTPLEVFFSSCFRNLPAADEYKAKLKCFNVLD